MNMQIPGSTAQPAPSSPAVTRTVVIASPIGLHARVAARFVQRVAGWHLPVTIARVGGKPVNAGSMIAVMGLNVRHGEKMELSASGQGAEEVLEDLAAELENENSLQEANRSLN